MKIKSSTLNLREKHFTGIAIVKTSADLGRRTRMSFTPRSLPDLSGFEVCTPVNPLREKFFSCCSNSLMGFPPVLGNPSKYSRILANTAHNRRSEQGNLCVVFTNLCYQLGSGASSLCSLKSGHTHSVDLLCTSVCFILYGNYISQDFPNLNRLHFRYLNPKGKGMMPFQSGPANSKWKL